jgi:hypothetical protein
MALSITQSQVANLDWLKSTGSADYNPLEIINSVLEQYGLIAISNIQRNIKDRQVVNSGQMSSTMYQKLDVENGQQSLKIYIKDYYRFVDKGVKGVKSTKNAPKSPYRYRTLTGMSKEGRTSIQSLITSGKAKVRVISQASSKTEKRGLQFKGTKKSLLEMQTDQLIYNIKKYGIKTTNFFKDGFEQTFKDLQKDLGEALKRDISINLIK